MTLALLAMSHSPLLEHAELDADVSGELENAFAEARRFVHAFDPDVVVNFAPDHYNGFFYRLMPPFCVGYAAESIGDYGSSESTQISYVPLVLTADNLTPIRSRMEALWQDVGAQCLLLADRAGMVLTEVGITAGMPMMNDMRVAASANSNELGSR
jgi:hypothetical protein